MTDKRPTLTLKPKTKASTARSSAAKPGPARPSGPARPPAQAGQERFAKGPQAETRREQGRPAASQPRQERQERQERTQPQLRQSHEVKVAPQRDFRPDLKPDSLALALLGAANAVARVRAGAALPQALGAVFAAYDAAPQARGARRSA